MQYLARAIVLFFSLIIIATTSYSAELTEASVKQLISRVDKATNAFDSQAIAQEMSDDVSITLNMNIQGQQQTLTFTKQEYISLLKQSWSLSDYKATSSNIVIIIKGNKAFVTSDLEELITVGENSLSTNSKQKATIELIEGRPLITAITGDMVIP